MTRNDRTQPPRGRRIAGRAQLDHVDDPYQVTHKPPKGAVCGGCGAVFADGRWAWGPPPAERHAATCPACRRIADAYPAGLVTCRGGYLAGRIDEIVAIARACEAAERAEHPLNRIMAIETKDGTLTITTTDVHLPRRIGEALERAHDGSLEMTFDEDGYFVRVTWERGAG